MEAGFQFPPLIQRDFGDFTVSFRLKRPTREIPEGGV